jgi:uncharacterized protein YndB with AHSA1/START domain
MEHTKSLRVTSYGDVEIHITRTFDAPRTNVFEAMVRADLLKRWLTGPPGWKTTVCESDARVGGTYRQEWVGPDGTKMAMSGVYRAVVSPHRIVRTEIFEMGCDAQAGEQLATMTLDEEDGGRSTRLRIVVVYPSKEVRDMALASGMETGMEAGYANLDAALAK